MNGAHFPEEKGQLAFTFAKAYIRKTITDKWTTWSRFNSYSEIISVRAANHGLRLFEIIEQSIGRKWPSLFFFKTYDSLSVTRTWI